MCKTNIESDIATNEGETEFQLRFIKSEGIGLVTTKSERNYLILDSADFWYDCTQDSYPKIKKCTCKNDWFTLKFNYIYREHYGDIRNISVKTTCVQCGKISKALEIDVKYSPTDHLIKNPLTFCKKPKVKYGRGEMGGYWTISELDNNLRLLEELGFIIYVWYWDKAEQKRKLEILSMRKKKFEGTFLCIYLSLNELCLDGITTTNSNGEIFMKEKLWRKKEIIELQSANINGKMFYLMTYATQFIDADGEMQDKSKEFSAKIEDIKSYLKKRPNIAL